MVKLTLRDKESAQEAVRRFRKLVERSGIKKEMRIREFYEKPSETKRRARLRASAAPAATVSSPRTNRTAGLHLTGSLSANRKKGRPPD